LRFESFSFAYLLSYYCDIHISKAYQLADWRIRPLSKGFFFIYQLLRKIKNV
jgi:ribonuclease D